MRKQIFLITSKEECICPCCGGWLKYRDHRLRVHQEGRDCLDSCCGLDMEKCIYNSAETERRAVL